MSLGNQQTKPAFTPGNAFTANRDETGRTNSAPGRLKGLTEQEASLRIEREGFNELPSAGRTSTLHVIAGVLREPMFLLLVAGGAIYLAIGSKGEALMLLSFVFVVIGITVYQERKTERALEALRDLSSPRALVIRDGEYKRIAGPMVVKDDIIVLSEGDRIPADAVILESSHLSVDESLLTGESAPVRKCALDGGASTGIGECNLLTIGPPGGDDLPFVYSGTLVVQGGAIAQVLRTGLQTALGEIGKALQEVEPEDTPLQKESRSLVKTLAVSGAFLCLVTIGVYWLTRGHILEALLSGITLAMAIIPEEIPVVLTVFLALGAWRIAQKHVLTRRVPALEALGAATVLCVDKTGTLTLNQMTVRRLFSEGRVLEIDESGPGEIPEEFHELIEYGILASQPDPFDPMEKALHELGSRYLAETEHIHREWQIVREYPLSKEMLALSHVYSSPDQNDYVVAVKGAPEAVADLCHLSPEQLESLTLNVASMAGDSLRVLGVAKAYFRRSDLPDQQHDFDFDFLGLVGMSDPVRPTVPGALHECYDAGVRVVMVTGDYPVTAQNVGAQIGLRHAEGMVTGPELDSLDDGALRSRTRTANVFARAVPEHKLRLVTALKSNGEIVAMTGDGVNDAPALKSAHIGIAMGKRGTDVAREAASLVLLDDDFASIVRAVRLGRRIFDNLKKAVAYIFAIHVPIIGASLIPVILKWPLVLLPVHIVFLELIIDPACSIVFEAELEEPNVMRRPPRRSSEPLFNRRVIGLSVAQGMIVLVVTLAVFRLSLYFGASESEARALTFATLVTANLSLILTNRSWSRSAIRMLRQPNRALWWVVSAALILLAGVLYIPPLQRLFSFGACSPLQVGLSVVAGALSIIWFEVLKLLDGDLG
ncbi:MAG TPA: cation-translocating P-type ATPase [Blastocatellia bacterium]|nr:cation-translocating P-type ATPase [Blastocatellia bacterium]